MTKKLNRLGALLLCVLNLSGGLAVARETYAQLVVRMVEKAATANVERADLGSQLLQLANQYRRSNGLKPLKADQSNHDAAVAHAMDMMLHNYIGHVASTGHDFDSRMRALRNGAMVLPSMGENAARLSHADVSDANAANKIFQQWVNSSPHRHALLSRDYVSAATGVVAQDGKIYADQIFMGPDVVTNMGRVAPERADGLY